MLFLLLCCVAAQAQELPAPVAAALRRAGVPPEAIGVYVRAVESPRPLLAINPTLPLSPASTMKLFTTDAALETLGPAYVWKTAAYVRGRQQDGVLEGDLILRGAGDPHLVQENLWLFLRRIRDKGIRDIRGDLLLDRSLFADDAHDAALFDGEPLKSYNAGADALLLNFNAFAVRLVPDQAAGRAQVLVEPPVAGLAVSGPRLVGGDCGDWKGNLSPRIDDAAIAIEGDYPYACGEKEWFIHPYGMKRSAYFGAVFRQIWKELGGSFSGTVRDAPLPADARLVAEWQSEPLGQVVRDINKYSNNVMARQLLLTLGAESGARPADAASGAQAVRAWLARKGIPAPELVIDNGSGLSRNARVSADTMGRMLITAFHAPTMPEFIASLPIAALDGSMRNRLRDSDAAGRAHLKTGTLEGVRAIAGYVLSASGRRYALVCLVNHPNATASLRAMDALLQWVYERG
ncbi:D-alanyl-D-alanine carboxypeptidase/D-alanyl-D-alanine endopeptidase [Noviherbaspirillum pedocola]|uniref:D-alanyl-D-alanine carboxypeptidase/D-alanyl-D-alanine endopeptidase n=1 Tax=Noviherbaspirillum pedocola TaxID=2801341 RepID=UPI001F24D2CC|nr:D-alanyl-D-alanine carboxypeptidase/D-alanyl-D-alanine-endopeptidase [Noviherbaspirillum pedocola]